MKVPSLFLASLLTLSACGAESSDGDTNLPSCEEDDRDETYVAGIAKTGPANYGVALMDSNPAPPSRGDNIWSVEVNAPDGSPGADLAISLSAFMPDHGHGTPVKPAITDDGAGAYTVDPVNLFMPGYWEVSLIISDPGATEASDDDVELDTVMFKFCVEG